MNNSNSSYGIFIDFSKAFHIVDHKILLHWPKATGKATSIADDIVIQYSNANWNNIVQDMKTDISMLKSWCEDKNMEVNTDNIKFSIFI